MLLCLAQWCLDHAVCFGVAETFGLVPGAFGAITIETRAQEGGSWAARTGAWPR